MLAHMCTYICTYRVSRTMRCLLTSTLYYALSRPPRARELSFKLVHLDPSALLSILRAQATAVH